MLGPLTPAPFDVHKCNITGCEKRHSPSYSTSSPLLPPAHRSPCFRARLNKLPTPVRGGGGVRLRARTPWEAFVPCATYLAECDGRRDEPSGGSLTSALLKENPKSQFGGESSKLWVSDQPPGRMPFFSSW
ncbi:hypothetical protein EVAR_17661_1 [Eumeta japonica]|uniref:Uncharacterized protein n=1 Tax=Eumeta variegata TaxID=151549 RepID=A0A4C1UTH4_EUMVA|nr:hypothetical protein EVAR_17661_1 [Eumeta japonica]